MSRIRLLPPELIGLVVEFVEPKTLPALRLTSQTLCHQPDSVPLSTLELLAGKRQSEEEAC